jgi:hypothetical protein
MNGAPYEIRLVVTIQEGDHEYPDRDGNREGLH